MKLAETGASTEVHHVTESGAAVATSPAVTETEIIAG